MTRRTFLSGTGCSLAATVLPAAAPPIRLGIDTYSLRAFRWKAPQLLDYAAAQKLDTIQISGLGEFESTEPADLARIKDHATRLGISVEAGIGCICPTAKSWSPRYGTPTEYLQLGLRVAKAVGSTSLRCFMGNEADRRGPRPLEAHIEETVKVLRTVRSLAVDSGIRIAVENHAGDMQARELRMLIEEAGKEYVAACLDTGNPMWVVEDPLVALEVLAPYTVTTHIRDSVVWEHPRGAAAQWVALGDGSIDFYRFTARFRELCPQSAMQLEIITGRPPRVLPYFEPEFWKAFPRANAAEFARFAELARKGHPFMGSMIIADTGEAGQPPEFTAALKAQQQRDLERSLAFARTKLNVGVRWRS